MKDFQTYIDLDYKRAFKIIILMYHTIYLYNSIG